MSDLKGLSLPAAATLLALQGRVWIYLRAWVTVIFFGLLIAFVILVVRELCRWFLGVSYLSTRVRRLEAEVVRLGKALGAAGLAIPPEEDLSLIHI